MVLLFANGELEDNDGWIQPFFENAPTIIAADGGARHLHALNHPPHIIIGDMDSLSATVRDWLIAANTAFITHPPAKNETDLELALRYAAEEYNDDIFIFAALGGRLDQMLGNIHLLTHPALDGRARHSRVVRLVTRYQQAWLLEVGENRINGRFGDTLSLIPLNGDAKISETSGLQWPLHNEWLRFGATRGISNRLTAVNPTITLEKGTILCVHTQKEWRR